MPRSSATRRICSTVLADELAEIHVDPLALRIAGIQPRQHQQTRHQLLEARDLFQHAADALAQLAAGSRPSRTISCSSPLMTVSGVRSSCEASARKRREVCTDSRSRPSM